MNTDFGNDERYEQFLSRFAQHHERLFRYIFSLVPNHQDAEDVFQKTSIVLWRKFDQFSPDGDFYAWAAQVAYFEVRNYRRTSARDRLFFSEGLMATLADERETSSGSFSKRIEALRDCLKNLNPTQRDLVKQAYTDGTSIGSLAEETGRAVQTVYNHLYRIRRILFDCVQKKLTSKEASS